jgi:hypothetical protein
MPPVEKGPRNPHVKIPRLEARLRKELLLERVAELDPQLATELRAIDATLAVYETRQGTRYAFTRKYAAAVDACLRNCGRWMRPREIAFELAEGGFILDPANGPRLVVDAIAGMVESGKLLRHRETVGLLNWHPDVDPGPELPTSDPQDDRQSA